MNSVKVRRKHLPVASAVAAAVAALGAAHAVAQDIRIEVTGSNIKRVEGEGPSAITVITRDEIDKSGATSAMELMNYIAANNSAGNVNLANLFGATTFGNQTASLRGLGGQRTLVLVNGKRLNSFAGAIQGAEGVNLQAIPFSAIERVEVLKDGASAIYGSDAVAGVINFILRQDYRGAEVTGYFGEPTRDPHDHGREWNVAGSVGFGDLSKDRYNAFFSARYDHQDALNTVDREFSNTAVNVPIGLASISSNTFPGFITTRGVAGSAFGTGPLGFPQGAPPAGCAVGSFATYFPDLDPSRCYYDPEHGPNVQQIPDTKQTNVYGSLRFQINADWQAYLTGFYGKQETRNEIQPVPLSDQFVTPPNNPIFATFPTNYFHLPPTSAFYPHQLAASAGIDGTPLNIRYRSVLTGNRITTDTNEGWQTDVGIKGTWRTWDVDLDFAYNKGNTDEKLNGGFPLLSCILPLLNSGQINPFGPTPDAAAAQAQACNYNGGTFNGEATAWFVNGKASGEIWKLPAGPLAMAVGFQFGKETLDENPSPVLATGDVSGYGGNLLPISASRRLYALFAEFNVPIVKNLEVTAAVRYDHYSDFGSTTNPKLSVRWTPVKELLMRASWGTGFLAPTLYQLYVPQTQGVTQTGLSDPLRCPVTNDGNDCLTQFPQLNGGNPALQPEKSTSTSVGFVVEPSSLFNFSADYFWLDLKNTITNAGIPVTTILTDPASYGNLVVRGPVQPQFPNLPGPITNIIQLFQNIGDTKIEGIDFALGARTPMSSIGRFRISVDATYYNKYDVQNPVDGSYAGFVSNAYGAVVTGITPRFKTYIPITWENGPWSLTFANNYQSDYIDVQTDGNGDLRRVGAMSLWDAQLSYSGFKNLTLAIGAKNIFDRNPPVSNQNVSFVNGYDPSYYDPRARFVYGTLTYSFK
ncbi:MAG TPA: TonB-dependent receptor [Casimicrobiaceae bacterium]|nr:TonB-dependent receptor [Casimicrobiaceae bacterium]